MTEFRFENLTIHTHFKFNTNSRNALCSRCDFPLFIKIKEDSFKCYICHDFYYITSYNTLYSVIPLEICVI